MRGVGSFGGVFSAKAIAAMDDPVLVASTDGVGTKVELAARLGTVRGVGMDIVNHCIDDVLVQSARPLFFLDYIAASVLDADLVAEVVGGMAEACEAAGCALLGGETAEMPGVYAPGAFDIAGTLVGVAERAELLPRADVAAGDVLDRRRLERPAHQRLLVAAQAVRVDPDGRRAGRASTGRSARRCSSRTASYLDVLGAGAGDAGGSRRSPTSPAAGCPRTCPGCCPTASTPRSSSARGRSRRCSSSSRELATGLDAHELHRTLNMGIGMVVVCAAGDAAAVQASIPEETWVIGDLVAGADRFGADRRPA